MNAVIYARYSSDNQREESIEGQLRECMEFANSTGVTVVGNYIDRAFSAKTDKSSPQLKPLFSTAVPRYNTFMIVTEEFQEQYKLLFQSEQHQL